MAYADNLRTEAVTMEDAADLVEGLLAEVNGYTEAAGATNTTSTSFTNYRSNTLTLTVAAGETVVCWANLMASHGSSGGVIEMTISEDGVDLSHYTSIVDPTGGTGGQNVNLIAFGKWTPSAGSHVYRIRWRCVTGTIYSTRGFLFGLKVRES